MAHLGKWSRLCISAAAVAMVFVSLASAAEAARPLRFAMALKVIVPWDREYLCWTQFQRGSPIMDGHMMKPGSRGESRWGTDYESTQTAPRRFKGKTATIALADFPPPGGLDLMIVVYDVITGNEAIEHLTLEIAQKGLTLKERDFDEVRRVRIKITADHGKPVESALVELKDIADKTKVARVDPTTVGVAEFLDVTAGEATVTVLYGDNNKATQQIDIPEERDEIIFTTEVPVAGPVVTIEEPKAGEEAAPSGKEKSRRSGSEWAATLLGSIVGFLIVVAIVVGAIYYLKSRGVTVIGGLKKMGVQLPEYEPEDQAAPAAPAADPDVCPFCGQRKDAQGQCACAISAQPAPSGATSGPRLIGSQGAYSANIFELTSDVTTLGREPDNSVPLPNDTTVSRHHARIALENGEYVAYDAGSSNGVFVNGEKITQRALRPGDEVQIGTTKFRFEV